MALRFIAVAPNWLIAARSGPERLRAVSGTGSARSGVSSNEASSRSALPVAEAIPPDSGPVVDESPTVASLLTK